MELIVDANILFAALIKQSVTATLLCRSDIRFYTPEYIFEEFKKYEGDILIKTKRNYLSNYRSQLKFFVFYCLGALQSKRVGFTQDSRAFYL